ncbi:unnamed protein product [marine sediment metagenome]|uniref:Uncharacterized protein n=1 Tax=marine sediment metagenome TaxID=412755 RepID=X1BJW2_9ZZZZ
MAVSDLYELRWRTEMAAVVMNNSVLYEQTEANIGTFLSPALALLSCIQEGTANVLAFWRLVGCNAASITCAIAEKVLDLSATGPEQAILFDQAFTAVAANPMAPSQCFTVDMWTNSDSGDRGSRRFLYLGGLTEDILDGLGVSAAVGTSVKTNQSWLLNPETAQPGIEPFHAVLPLDSEVGLAPQRTVTRANPPFYLTRKNSRRLRLCV